MKERKQKNGDPDEQERTVTFRQMGDLVQQLCALPLEERKRIPGMMPERADIIVAGAAIAHTLMEDLGVEKIRISPRGLRHGLLVDYLTRGTWGYLDSSCSVREQSVLQLGRSCGFYEDHSRHLGRLCTELFDSAKDIGLHSMGNDRQELLYYAALLHDIGIFLSFSNHHAHSAYLIKNELLGFYNREIAVMSALAFFHRKRAPKSDPEFAALDAKAQRIVFPLGMVLRMAESLDRSHKQSVRRVAFTREKGALVSTWRPRGVARNMALEEHQKYFVKTFGETV